MKTFILDTSVAVKWFSREKDTDRALHLREMMMKSECRAAAPDLLLFELANALRNNPSFNERDVKLALRSVMDMGIRFAEPDITLLEQSIRFAFRFRVTFYDGCFLALAEVADAVLISADDKLIEKAKGYPRFVRLSRFQP